MTDSCDMEDAVSSSTEATSTISVDELPAPNLELAAGLREVADWLEAHPELPGMRGLVSVYPWGEDARDELTVIAEALGHRATERVERGRVQIEAHIGGVRVYAESSIEHIGGVVPVTPTYRPIIPREKR